MNIQELPRIGNHSEGIMKYYRHGEQAIDFSAMKKKLEDCLKFYLGKNDNPETDKRGGAV